MLRDVCPRGGARVPVAFAPEFRSLLLEVALLYKHMYENVYYCWENACAQSMIGLAIEELLESSRMELRDLLRLTDCKAALRSRTVLPHAGL